MGDCGSMVSGGSVTGSTAPPPYSVLTTKAALFGCFAPTSARSAATEAAQQHARGAAGSNNGSSASARGRGAAGGAGKPLASGPPSPRRIALEKQSRNVRTHTVIARLGYGGGARGLLSSKSEIRHAAGAAAVSHGSGGTGPATKQAAAGGSAGGGTTPSTVVGVGRSADGVAYLGVDSARRHPLHDVW